MFAGRKMLRSCHVAIICDQSNSLLKMLMVDAQKLSRTLVRQFILPFSRSSGRSYPSNVTDDLLQCHLKTGKEFA